MAPHAERRRPVLPPLDTVRRLQRALTRSGLPSVIGGSGLLAASGLVNQVNDWDVVVDADPRAVQEILDDLALPYRRRTGSSDVFRTEALFTIDAGDHQIDVLVRFALDSPDGVVPIPADPGGSWNGLIMARPQDWVVAYRLLGRTERAEVLQRHLDTAGSERPP